MSGQRGDLRVFVEHVRTHGAQAAIVFAFILQLHSGIEGSATAGWRRATVAQITAGTGLNHKQVRTAIDRLRMAGVIESTSKLDESTSAQFWAARR